MKIILLMLASISSPPENAKDCLVADTHYYTDADIEQFPAQATGEIDFKASQVVAKDGGIVFEILVDRCSHRIASLIKLKAGKPVYGFRYKYKEGKLVGLDFRYIDGEPTTQEILDHI